ncbi:MAG TPA: TlpA family protein disulfide reductase, partial [Myxococcota bacterium]
MLAPQFMLPVVNDFAGGKKWGPAKWTGTSPAPDEPKKLVIMSFFATYCEPCKKEMPELARIYDAYKDQGLGVMLVSIDKGDDQKQVIVDLAKLNKVNFPVMHDRFQVVARRYSAERLPYMLMLDTSGTVKTVHVGYTDDVKNNLENEVRAGLGLPPQAATPPADPKKTAP